MIDRYILIGDMHGCFDIVLELLKKISPGRKDLVVCLGDFVDRGPHPDLCLEYWKEHNYLAVLGNHDKRIIDWSDGKTVPSGEGLEDVIEMVASKPSLIEYLKSLPYYIKFDSINTIAVHAALDINQPKDNSAIHLTQKNILLRGRYVRLTGKEYEYIELGKELQTDELWADRYDGRGLVVYGHTPWLNYHPRISSNAIGIDTAAVYGGKLTALIIERNNEISFISVDSRKQYWQPAKKGSIIVV